MILPNGFFSQVATIVLAGAIVVTYVKPTFESIGVMQSDIVSYQEQRDKVVSVNSKLAALVSRFESVSADDKRKLLVYMPDELDEVAVQRDLVYIAEQSGVFFQSVQYEDVESVVTDGDDEVADPTVSVQHNFTLGVEGTYAQIKTLFSLLEKNQYPLELQQVSIKPLEGGFLSASIAMTAFAYQPFITGGAIQNANSIDF